MAEIRPMEVLMGRTWIWFSILAVCFMFPSRLFALQFGGGNPANEHRQLSGNVYYGDTHAPADHVSVELYNSAGELLAPATTSESGYFQFIDLSLGTYEITINAPGYQMYRETEELSFTSVVGLSIYLTPASKGAGSGSQAPVSAHELSMPQKARDLVDSGKKKLYQDKDAKAAILDFQGAVAAAPDYYEAFYQMAMAYVTLGDVGSAQKYLEKSKEISGDKYGEADVGLGTLQLNAGNMGGAEKEIRHGIELEPTYWLGFYELGRVQLNEDKLDDAKKSANQALSLEPNEPVIYRLLTNVDLRQKNYASALKDVDAYLKLDPDSSLSAHAKELRQQLAQKVASQQAPPPAAKP